MSALAKTCCVACMLVLVGSLSKVSFALQTLPESPKLFKGKVVDTHDVPIPNAVVRGKLTSWDKLADNDMELAKFDLVTNEHGEFQAEVKKPAPVGPVLFLELHAGTKSHFTRRFHFSEDQIRKESVDLGTLKIAKGVRVTGQLVSPDSRVVPKHPTAVLHAEFGRILGTGDTSFYRCLNCDGEGKFECVVPNKSKLYLTVGADNFAMSESIHNIDVKFPESTEEVAELKIGPIQLKRGVSVVGTAIRKDGSPARGVVVGIVEYKDNGQGNLEDGDGSEVLHVSAAKTDGTGKFRLPPHTGTCSLVVLKACRNRRVVDGDIEMLKSDGKVPFFDPLDVILNGNVDEHKVELKEIDSIKVSGEVFDAQGKPVSGVTIEHGWVSRFGLIEFSRSKTDANGRYSILMGKGRKPHIRLGSKELDSGESEAWLTKMTVEAYAVLIKDSGTKRLRNPEFNRFHKHVTHLDWEVLPAGAGESSMLDKAGEVAGWLLFGD